MILAGTVFNITMSASAILYMSMNGEMLIFVLLYFSPVPYNIFIVYSVWKCAGRIDGFLAVAAKLVSLCWVLIFFFL